MAAVLVCLPAVRHLAPTASVSTPFGHHTIITRGGPGLYPFPGPWDAGTRGMEEGANLPDWAGGAAGRTLSTAAAVSG